MRRLIAIDPGSEESGIVVLHDGLPALAAVMPNADILSMLVEAEDDVPMAIEAIACYGMKVGREVFDTCEAIGRFRQAWEPRTSHKVYRIEVVMNLCHSSRAGDSNVRAALIDRYGPGRSKAIGTKKAPGPLYSVKSHAWQALGVGVTWLDEQERRARMTSGGEPLEISR